MPPVLVDGLCWVCRVGGAHEVRGTGVCACWCGCAASTRYLTPAPAVREVLP